MDKKLSFNELLADRKAKSKMKVINSKKFANGTVYALQTIDGYPIETTDTFLPYYTKDAIGENQNKLKSYKPGSRRERWMIGISVMSGCPVRCKFCATGKLKKWKNLTSDEMMEQIFFVINKNALKYSPHKSQEFKINYTRMGEPFLNINAVKDTILKMNNLFPNTHHYISTIGLEDADYSWIQENVTLQISLHAMNDKKRNWLIPYKHKALIRELGSIRTNSNLKTTLNLTLVNELDFDINILQKYFDKNHFFIKLSPINPNTISDNNEMGTGAIEGLNLI